MQFAHEKLLLCGNLDNGRTWKPPFENNVLKRKTARIE